MLLACSPLVAQFDPALYGEMRWRMIGPHRGGRTVSISGVPGKQNVFYIGVNNGGGWRPPGFGPTWGTPFSHAPPPAAGAAPGPPPPPPPLFFGPAARVPHPP